MSLPEQLKMLRERQRMTVEQVAEAIGMHPAKYFLFERGDRLPNDIQLAKLAKLHGVTFQRLEREKGAHNESV